MQNKTKKRRFLLVVSLCAGLDERVQSRVSPGDIPHDSDRDGVGDARRVSAETECAAQQDPQASSVERTSLQAALHTRTALQHCQLQGGTEA